jgi:hypothetical protein
MERILAYIELLIWLLLYKVIEYLGSQEKNVNLNAYGNTAY